MPYCQKTKLHTPHTFNLSKTNFTADHFSERRSIIAVNPFVLSSGLCAGRCMVIVSFIVHVYVVNYSCISARSVNSFCFRRLEEQ